MQWPYITLELVRERQREMREQAARAHLASALIRQQREARRRQPGPLGRAVRRMRGAGQIIS